MQTVIDFPICIETKLYTNTTLALLLCFDLITCVVRNFKIKLQITVLSLFSTILFTALGLGSDERMGATVGGVEGRKVRGSGHQRYGNDRSGTLQEVEQTQQGT